MIESIRFHVKKWAFNSNAQILNPKTDCLLEALSLRSQKNPTVIAGLGLIWILSISDNDLEILYYSSEEQFLFLDKNISDSQLLVIIRQSYKRTNAEVSARNEAVSLNAAFPPFDEIPLNLSDIRALLTE